MESGGQRRFSANDKPLPSSTTVPYPKLDERDIGDNDDDDNDGDDIHNGSPLDWILDSKSPMLASILSGVRDRRLPDRMIAAIGALERRPGEVGCIKLLLCKCAPFVWGMQQSIGERLDGADPKTTADKDDDDNDDDDGDDNNDASGGRLSEFFKHLPRLEEFRKNGDECERRHAACFAKAS